VLDDLLQANPKKLDDERKHKAREWIYGYMRKFGKERDPHPPDQQIVAQFLAVAPWPQLEGVLQELWRKRQPAGDTYAWFVGVALQRIHGLRFDDVRQRRAELKLVARHGETMQPQPPAEQQPLLPATELQAQIAQAAQRKALR